jgi:DNA-binding transcriptional ArsR family regulator
MTGRLDENDMASYNDIRYVECNFPRNMMNAYQIQAQFYKILMHPTRQAILDILRDGEQCVCHMEASLGLRQAHISQHLMVLREAGLVMDRRDGWNIFYRVLRPDVYAIIDAMEAFSGVAGKAQDGLDRVKKHPCRCPKCNEVSTSGEGAAFH